MIQKAKREPLGFYLTLVLLCVPICFRNLYASFHVPYYLIRQGLLGLGVLLLACMIKDSKRILQREKAVFWVMGAICFFFLSTLVGGVHHFLTIGNYLSGLWTFGQFFLFFFACILYLNRQNGDLCLRFLDWVFVVNFLVALFQFFVLGIQWDYLGGMFGANGGSGETHMLQLVVVTASVVRYLQKEEKGWVCIAKCAMALIVASLCELKIFYVEVIGIFALALLMNQFSRRTLNALILGVIGLVLSLNLLNLVYPFWKGWFNLDYMIQTVVDPNGYTNSGDFNRLTSISRALNEFLHTPGDTLFGLGLGNCNSGFLPGLNSEFYTEYSWLNYSFFTTAVIILETGLVGTVSYLGIFLVMLIAGHRLERSGKVSPVYCQIGKICALACFGLYFYDATLHTEHGYFLYFALALPFLRDGASQSIQ